MCGKHINSGTVFFPSVPVYPCYYHSTKSYTFCNALVWQRLHIKHSTISPLPPHLFRAPYFRTLKTWDPYRHVNASRESLHCWQRNHIGTHHLLEWNTVSAWVLRPYTAFLFETLHASGWPVHFPPFYSVDQRWYGPPDIPVECSSLMQLHWICIVNFSIECIKFVPRTLIGHYRWSTWFTVHKYYQTLFCPTNAKKL